MPSVVSKFGTAKRLLLQGSILVYFDPRVEGTLVPRYLFEQSSIVLEFGYDMAIPVPDLTVTGDAISGSLCFARKKVFCRIPWSSVYAIRGYLESKAVVWMEDVPEDEDFDAMKKSPARRKSAKASTSKKREFPPYLRLVK